MTMISVSILLALSWNGCTNAFHATLSPAASIGCNNRATTAPIYLMGHQSSSKSNRRPSSIPFLLKMSPSDNNSNDTNSGGSGSSGKDMEEQLRQTASKLRAEVQAAEEALEKSRPQRSLSTKDGTNYVKPVEYLELKDSCWEITYRFANEPASTNNSDDDNDDKNKNKVQRKSYGGKFQIKFRDDGYTDILPPLGDDDADNNSSSNSNTANAIIQKVWGWDLETSTVESSSTDEDLFLDYLLFSADVSLPPPISTSERFYFQARVDKEKRKTKDGGVLSLQDGSITVKRNVEAPGGLFGWGIFRGAGSILAQFREVGEFRCRAISKR